MEALLNNFTQWQFFTVSKTTKVATVSFTDEPATNKILMATATGTVTVSFTDGTSDITFDVTAGQIIAFDETVSDVSTSATAVLA